jgi:hypothetical protein
MNKPSIPKLPVPMLTEVVQVNGSLRPAVLPWTVAKQTEPPVMPAGALAPDQEALADQVIARVQLRLAQILPELMRNAVDEVLKEHLAPEPQPQPRSK